MAFSSFQRGTITLSVEGDNPTGSIHVGYFLDSKKVVFVGK